MTTLLGLLAGALTTISFIPQALQALKTRNTKGISLPMYMIFVSGVLLWLIYGLLIDEPPVYIANAITFVLSLSILMMKIRYG